MYWLRQLKDPALTDFEAWQAALRWPVRPSTAKGSVLQRDARLAAGMTNEFVDELTVWEDPASNVPPS